LLLALVAAVLAGAQSLAAVGGWVADAPPQVLAALGIRRAPLTGRFQPPDEATIRRVLESWDAGAVDAAAGSWLAGRLQAGDQRPQHGRRARQSLAVDGQAVRGHPPCQRRRAGAYNHNWRRIAAPTPAGVTKPGSRATGTRDRRPTPTRVAAARAPSATAAEFVRGARSGPGRSHARHERRRAMG
jgi:hypothetical protein